jgi:hypothetical protein
VSLANSVASRVSLLSGMATSVTDLGVALSVLSVHEGTNVIACSCRNLFGRLVIAFSCPIDWGQVLSSRTTGA